MFLCMRTTVDIPDLLVKRIKSHTAERSISFRSLVIAALEKELAGDNGSFRLRDASAGDPKKGLVSSEKINQDLNTIRDFDFQP